MPDSATTTAHVTLVPAVAAHVTVLSAVAASAALSTESGSQPRGVGVDFFPAVNAFYFFLG